MRSIAVLLTLTLTGCAVLDKPCSPVCGPGQTCVAGVCLPPAPQPTPTPAPEPTPEPTPTPTPTPPVGDEPLDPAMLPPVLHDSEWTVAGVEQNNQMGAAVKAATQRAQAARPDRWAGRCSANGVAGVDILMADISRELHRVGIKAGQGANDANPKADHLYVNRPGTDVWEQLKVFEYEHFCLTGNPFKYAWRPTVAVPAPQPTPTPGPPVSGCGDPQPPPLGGFVTHRTNIRDGWEKIDATPVTAEGNRAYCDSVGFQNRNSCPARAEKPAWPKEDRLACERVMLRGSAPLFKWTGDDRDGGLWSGNPNGFSFEHRKGSAGSLSVCDAVGEKCKVVF